MEWILAKFQVSLERVLAELCFNFKNKIDVRDRAMTYVTDDFPVFLFLLLNIIEKSQDLIVNEFFIPFHTRILLNGYLGISVDILMGIR